MNNENRIDNNSFVTFGIDKIALRMESRHLNYAKSPEGLRHIIDIETIYAGRVN